MKSIEDFAAALVDAVKGARDLEQQRKDAQQAVARAQAEASQIRASAEKARADARAEIATDKAQANQRIAQAEMTHAQKLASEKAEHDAYVSNAKAQVLQLSEALTALQAEIAEARLVRDNINAENAKLLAAFGESAKKLGHG